MAVALHGAAQSLAYQPVSGAPIHFSTPGNDDHSPQALSHKLTSNFTSERKKVEAIFRWITGNIDYKTNHSFLRRITADEDTGALKPLNERVSEQVLAERVAFCEGYSRLFQTLCTYAGIESHVVTGYVRDNVDRPGKRFSTNHSWNVVKIDGTWHVVDATWAAGFLSWSGNRFIRHYDDYYFLTPPHQFIRSHYPEDLQWTLIDQPPVIRELQAAPFKFSGYSTRMIKSHSPAKGVIDVSAGDTIIFELEVDDTKGAMQIVEGNTYNSLPITQVSWWEVAPAPFTQKGNKISATYVVNEDSPPWIHVVYQHAVVLRYHLKVKS